MRKTMILLAAALMCVCSMMADEVSVGDVTIPQGGQATVSICLSNPNKEYTAGQMVMVLPEGVTAVLKDNGDPTTAKSERMAETSHSIGASHLNDGTDQFTIFSISSEAIPGTDGPLFIVTVTANAELAVGTTLEAWLTNIEMTTTDAVPTPFNNKMFIITIGEPDDGRIHFDETSATLPAYTAGAKADVTVFRTIKAGEWSTLVLPFNLTRANATAAFGSDVQFAKFDGFEVDYGDDEENVTPLGITINLSSYTIPARGNMAGGTPVLIKTSQDIEEIRLDGVTLTTGVKDVDKADDYDTPGKLTGTLVKTTIPEDGLFISSDKFWYSTGKTTVKAFRCWFELGAVLDKETDFGARVQIAFTEETTAIEDTSSANPRLNDNTVYDLQGRQIVNSKSASSKLPKGLYIKGGKKIINK